MRSDENETLQEAAAGPELTEPTADPAAAAQEAAGQTAPEQVVSEQAAPQPPTLAEAEPAGESLAELRARLAQAETENSFVRADLTSKLKALSLKLDAANQELEATRSGGQAEIQRLQDEVTRLNAANARAKEDQDLYKEVGDGQQEAVRKLMDRADLAQARADAATRRVRTYTVVMLFTLLIAVAAVGVCVLIVLRLLGY